MKKYILLIISLINIAVTGVFIAFNPNEELPSHYNVNGIADAIHQNGCFYLFRVFLYCFQLYMRFTQKVKENDENYKSYRKYAVRCIVSFLLFVFLFFWMLIALVLQNKVNIDNLFLPLTCIFMGCMFVYLFNLMPKIKQNSLLGIRTNATLSSKSVWKKVHRFAAYFG